MAAIEFVSTTVCLGNLALLSSFVCFCNLLVEMGFFNRTLSRNPMIHLGYETGTARPVAIPLAHMAITGLTQQSGKTTTLEALIDRGNLRAVVFVTKPGEKSFTEGRRILPFFKEHADWEYVKDLLEARRAESLTKWDGYLMRVCSRARTLKDVRHNVQKELPKKKSARPSHYEVLAGYLDLIIPELDAVPYTDKLELERGVNIMDLCELSDDMQSMVIRSTIEQIHKREHHTVLVLPEAWKFIPEGGRSAVFQALHAFIREGATNGNFVWIDAQDLAVVSKRILKSVSVWILGKQQEANEVARTINHLIEPLQIRPDMIKSLAIGQFLVCAESLPARRVYVQPRWLGELDAQAIARGEESVETAQAIWKEKLRELKRNEKTTAILPATRQGRAGDQMRVSAAVPASHGDGGPGSANASDTAGGADPTPASSGTAENSGDAEREDAVWKERAEKAESEVRTLRLMVEDLQQRLTVAGAETCLANDRAASADGVRNFSYDVDQIYAAIKARALQDSEVLQILARRPELRVRIEPKVLEVDEASLRGALALLIHRQFFTLPRNGHVVFKELQRLGKRMAKPNVYRELKALAEMGFLTQEADGYLATNLKVTVHK
jgi:hypothetical protein